MSVRQAGAASSRADDVITRGEVQALIAASSGGGGTPLSAPNQRVPFAIPRVTDWITQHAGALGSAQPSNGELWSGQLFLPSGTYDQCAFQVDAAGSTGAVAKVILYADDTGRPGALALDTAAVDCTSTGAKILTGINLVVPDGGRLFWAGTATQGAPTTLPKFWKVNLTAQPMVATSNRLTVLGSVCYVTTGVTGAAPASTGTNLFDGHTRLAFRRSA